MVRLDAQVLTLKDFQEILFPVFLFANISEVELL